MAKTPKEQPAEKTPLSDAERAALTAVLASGPKDGVKFSDAEREARKTAKQKLLEHEGPKERFQRLSKARLNEALDVIALIGNLSGANYEYTDNQVAFIRAALHKDVEKACDRFKPKVKDAERTQVEIPAD